MQRAIVLPDFSAMGWIIFFLLLALPILPNLWSIFHVWRHNYSSGQEKILWLICAAMLPLIGGLIYIAVGRARVIRSEERPAAGAPRGRDDHDDGQRPPYVPDP